MGDLHLYTVEVQVDNVSVHKRIGFRTVRTETQTTLRINDVPLYIRGTSYFADAYLSNMTRERYLRDLRAIRDTGFNLVRGHVHVEMKEFYELCDELGLAVMQDSEYNWMHPQTEAWTDRLVSIYLDTMKMLNGHPSIVTWVCLNEPGFSGGAIKDRTGGDAIALRPEPQLYNAVINADPTRTVIRGSFCNEDLLSGDSHTYRGSLEGNHENYKAIDGTTEKLNSEFGFDAPALRRICAWSLKGISA